MKDWRKNHEPQVPLPPNWMKCNQPECKGLKPFDNLRDLASHKRGHSGAHEVERSLLPSSMSSRWNP